MLPSIWYAQATEGLYLLTAVRGQHLNLRLSHKTSKNPSFDREANGIDYGLGAVYRRAHRRLVPIRQHKPGQSAPAVLASTRNDARSG